MRLPGFDKRLQPAYRELARALARLDEEQGLVGRRNARQVVTKALKRVRDQVDDKYPTMRRKTTRRKRRTPTQRSRALRRDGWKIVPSMGVLQHLATIGIRTQKVQYSDSEGKSTGEEVYAPGWAIGIASMAPKKLARAKQSITERKAILVELSLSDDP